MKVVVTGAAGFIGFHLAKRLLDSGYTVMGIDNVNDYYSVELKRARLKILASFEAFSFCELDIANAEKLREQIAGFVPNTVCHLAAQAGVRESKKFPHKYIDSNVTGFLNVLETCRLENISNLFYASSSSVYGGNSKIPFAETDDVSLPTNIYAVTKRANEQMALAYHNLYKQNSTGFRFFTVYGPWGRPDMAYYFFSEKIVEGKPITVFNQGKMSRDFTYIDDIIDGIIGLMNKRKTSPSYCDVFNLGNGKPAKLMDFIKGLETALDKKAEIEFQPAQAEEMIDTWADISKAHTTFGYTPQTTLEIGLKKFADWYIEYRKTNSSAL